jgi:hypothetical protein
VNASPSGSTRSGLRAAATTVLIDNWRALHTVPAAGLYPHQWSWDSAFIAMGLRHVSPRRAQQELEALFSAQWDDGRLPQIVFDLRRDDDYSPGATFWRSEDIPGSPTASTSGFVQPPVHAWAALAVHRIDPAESRRRRFLERAYPRLLAWHEYLRVRRDRGGWGLASVVHPWESGMDNSPVWDAPLEGVPSLTGDGSAAELPRPDLLHIDASERPTSAEYGKYLYLTARYRDHRCDDADVGYPFLVEDPALNALWVLSELALAEIAGELGRPGLRHRDRAGELVSALDRLWDPDQGIYVARDVRSGAHAPHTAVAGLIPLLIPGLRYAPELLETLRGPRFALGQVHLVPSYDLTASGFDPARYWRGPSWFNTAWLIVQALRAMSLSAEARALAAGACELALAHDFPEYVDPLTAAPHGARSFSWTAALTLDLEVTQDTALPGRSPSLGQVGGGRKRPVSGLRAALPPRQEGLAGLPTRDPRCIDRDVQKQEDR